MPKVMNLDFRKAPPAQGGGTDKIPPGRYFLTVSGVSEPGNQSQTGKPMPVVNFKVARGELTGRRLRDQFVFPKSAEDSLFGMQRFHAFLLCLGLAVPSDRPFKLDLEKIVGKTCWAEVADGELPARGSNPARTVSQVAEYVMPVAAQNGTSAPAADDDEDEGEDEEVAASAPRRRQTAAPAAVAEAPRRRRAAAPPPVVEPDDEDGDDDDDDDELEVAASDEVEDDEFPFN